MSPVKVSILLGLSFFFGLAFEGFYAKSQGSRPGGIRTFPLISLSGALLYALEPDHAIAFCVGLVVLGIWLYPYYQAEVSRDSNPENSSDGIMVPMCNLVAYILGPVALTLEPWIAFGLAVAAVLLLQARERLHALAQTLPMAEVITLGQFLILTGIVLPLLPDTPVTKLSPITPFQVWLAVVVVSSLSYGSYLLQKLLSARRSLFVTSLLGGLYSSTALTVVLARRLKEDPQGQTQYQSGIVLATALMYLRLLIVVAIFNWDIARQLAPSLTALCVIGIALAALCLRVGKAAATDAAVQAAAAVESARTARRADLRGAVRRDVDRIELGDRRVRQCRRLLVRRHRRCRRHRSVCAESGPGRRRGYVGGGVRDRHSDRGIVQQPAEGDVCGRFRRLAAQRRDRRVAGHAQRDRVRVGDLDDRNLNAISANTADTMSEKTPNANTRRR